MSEQRRKRQELRQGFHQFAMSMYQSYLETHSEDEAKSMVADAIKEQLGLFMADDATFGLSVKSVINKKLEELTKGFEQASDYDSQMYLSEKIDTLTAALAILES